MSELDPQMPTFARPGALIAGKYRVEGLLGQGGMGTVVRATHVQLHQRVAIKFLLNEFGRKDELVARFLTEARSTAQLRSRHVVRILDVDVHDGGPPYMVMELLEGMDLQQWLRGHGPLPVNDALEYVVQACEALAEAHGVGIVHRDIKPSNLFLTRESDGSACIKVVDFGIAKRDEVANQSSTRSGEIMGSPGYMSPEQTHGAKDTDARTDIWALGVTLFELLTGVAPFRGNSVMEVLLQIVSSPPSSLRSLRPDAPPRCEAIVLRCLQKDRANRYATVRELAADLVECATLIGTTTRRPLALI